MLIIGRVPARFLLPLAAAAAVSAPLAIGLLRPYQVERLGSFLVGAHESPTGSGWAVRQAEHRGGLGDALRADRRPPAPPARAVPARAGDRPGAREPGRAVGAGRRGRSRACRDRPRLAARAGQRARPAHRTVPSSAEVWRSSWASRPSCRWGATSGCSRWPASRSRCSATAAPRWSSTWPRSASSWPFAATAPAGRCGPCRAWRNPRPRLVRATAVALSASLVLFGLYGWRLQSTEGPALQLAGQEQMTRCVRLPAPRGAITDRHDAPLAVNAVDAGSGIDRVRRRPRAAAGAARRRRPPRRARRRPARRPARAARARGGHDAGAPRGRRPAQHRRRGRARRGSPGCSWLADPRRAYPAGALLGPVLGFTGVATPDGRRTLARTCHRARSSGGPASSSSTTPCCAGSTAGSACTSTRGACRWRSGARQDPVPGRRPAALDRPGPAAAARRRPGRRRARAAATDGPDRRGGRDGPEVGSDPRDREHPVVRQQRLRAAARRRRASGRGRQRRGRRCSSTSPRPSRRPGRRSSSSWPRRTRPTRCFGPEPGRPDRGRLHLRRPHLRQLEADGPDEPGRSRSPCPTTSTSTSSPSPSGRTR